MNLRGLVIGLCMFNTGLYWYVWGPAAASVWFGGAVMMYLLQRWETR